MEFEAIRDECKTYLQLTCKWNHQEHPFLTESLNLQFNCKHRRW
uniref:Macaca fascicularis brain cDNA, clone: QflA-17467 n=1 Tax=Macaca fascicularis TaxID=9541 RepID=I7GLU0_MACFA|nr:unnamed protein product [Macaca fascicularis]